MENGLREYTVNDLPQFSPWPARLLGLDVWETHLKTPAAVHREFESDKWGRLLELYGTGDRTTTVEVAEAWMNDGPTDVLCSMGQRFERLALPEALSRHREIVASALHAQLPANALVELGAGFGAVILRLATDARFAGLKLTAAEYTQSGAELIRELANNAGIELQVGRCDLASDPITDLTIPSGAAIFTCMAAHYIPELRDAFIQSLLRLRPKVVVHFEPCFEHCDPATLIGAMRRRYIEVNDYNRNLMSLLNRHAQSGAIRILQETPAVIGVNPLLPISIIVWAAAEVNPENE
jgi:predicted O-methyltransferase YrrM